MYVCLCMNGTMYVFQDVCMSPIMYVCMLYVCEWLPVCMYGIICVFVCLYDCYMVVMYVMFMYVCLNLWFCAGMYGI